MPQTKILEAVGRHSEMVQTTFAEQAAELARLAEQVIGGFHHGHKLLLAASGSLGEVANLVANQFLYRLQFERPQLPAISLCHDRTLAASLERHGQTNQFLARQLQVVCAPGDLLLILSDGHHDASLEEAAQVARDCECSIALLHPQRNEWAGPPLDFRFRFATDNSCVMAEGGMLFGRLLCELVEHDLFGS
jgi:D-sedoheptulose 7-phosphate isomerase